MPRIPNFKAGAAIARLEPFTGASESFRGHAGGPSSYGWIRGTEHESAIKEIQPDYTVMSYNTPIAVHHEGGWHYPDTSHSPTTAKHQKIVRDALGIKNEREKTMERRANARAERDKAKAAETEQGLWSS